MSYAVNSLSNADIQKLVWSAYLTKTMTRPRPMVFLRIFAKNIAQLTRRAA